MLLKGFAGASKRKAIKTSWRTERAQQKGNPLPEAGIYL